MKINRGDMYLELFNSTKDKSIWVFRCKICLSLKEIYYYKVNTWHDKTCGCMNNRSICNFNITKDGHITSYWGFDLTTKVANWYLGFRWKYVHRIIAERFLPNPDNLWDINHKNWIKNDNRIENLEWCDRSYNIKHAIENGLKVYKKWFISKRRKLSDSDVKYILWSDLWNTELWKKFNVSRTAIYNIRKWITYIS
jgi:hypothetical protein